MINFFDLRVSLPKQSSAGPLSLCTRYSPFFGLSWLLRAKEVKTRFWFLAAYFFVVMNLAELVAYLTMRPFAGSGDTGRFNQGLHLSPWLLFVTGNVLLVIASRVLLLRVTPKLPHVVGRDRRKLWFVIGFAAFMMFLGESGLRIMALYPDHQWRWGLIGIPAFFCWIVLSSWVTAQNHAGDPSKLEPACG